MIVLPFGQSQNWFTDLFIARERSMAPVKYSGLAGERRGFLAYGCRHLLDLLRLGFTGDRGLVRLGRIGVTYAPPPPWRGVWDASTGIMRL